MVSRIIPVKSFDLIVFGATGDLACRKIFPALYNRMVAGQMPPNASIIGVARQEMTINKFKKLVELSLEKYLAPDVLNLGALKVFLSCFQYIALDVELDNNWNLLKKLVKRDNIRTFYLSVAPSLFEQIASRIYRTGLSSEHSRIVIEKPLGINEESAKALNLKLRKYFDEKQIYRIDHYLGKETVQNLMALRFSNILFEPLWNSKFIDHVQITVAEKIGVLGRGEYYDRTGALRDMVQNHIMQLLCLTAMEPPSRFMSDGIRDEKVKVIRALGTVSQDQIVRGQYWQNIHQNYISDVGNGKSQTESYLALKVSVNNWRWAGTPFYLRTGKKMRNQLSEIAIIFKKLPHSIFDEKKPEAQNELIIRLQPNDGITLKTNIKDPGLGGMRLTSVPLNMTFANTLDGGDKTPDAYERLIMDVIRGDQTLFMRGDEVEAAWKWIDPIFEDWETLSQNPEQYDSYTEGPKAADELLKLDDRKWRII